MNRAFGVLVIIGIGVGGRAAAPNPVPPPSEVSLLVVENLYTPGKGVETRRLVRVGFRDGKMQPPVTVWEGTPRLFDGFWRHHLVQNRYVVTASAGVIDVFEKK